MVMKLHQAKDMGDHFFLQIWLDDTREDPNNPGQPDPDWLRDWRWGKDVPGADIRSETRLLAQLELDRMNARISVISLPIEGEDL